MSSPKIKTKSEIGSSNTVRRPYGVFGVKRVFEACIMHTSEKYRVVALILKSSLSKLNALYRLLNPLTVKFLTTLGNSKFLYPFSVVFQRNRYFSSNYIHCLNTFIKALQKCTKKSDLLGPTTFNWQLRILHSN